MTVTDAVTPIVTSSSLGGAQGKIGSEISSWEAAATQRPGDLIDTCSGTATYSVINGTLNSGAVIAGTNYSQSVGSAVGFYNIVSHRPLVRQHQPVCHYERRGLLVPVGHAAF